MNLELLILAITIFLIANTYYEGKLLDTLKRWKKYYQIAFYAVAGLGLFLFIKKNPQNGKELFSNANQFVKYLPVDKNTANMLTPIFNLTNNNNNNNNNNNTPQYKRMINSGGSTSKRSVSETKKKYIAAQQGWKCNDCKCQLPAWFEIDHSIRLDQGGSNHIDNLVALCRNCHGKKTALENL